MAGSAVVGLLKVLLTADTAEFDSAMKRVSSGANAWAKDLGSIGRQATALGSALTKTLTLPILGIGIGAVKAASDFESSFANVAKTVDGVSDKAGVLTKEGEALALVFRQMAKEIPATTAELNAIAAIGGQMGVPIAKLAEFTRNVAALGVAVDGISAEEAAAGLAQIGNITGRGTKDIQQMASALVHLGNSSNATEGQILEFTKRMMGTGNAVGMTVPQVMALGTAMADVGINAEAGGTAMNTVISKMSSAVSHGGDALKEFARVAGVSASEFANTFKTSPIDAIDQFIKGLSRLKGEGVDLNLTMGDLGTEGIRVAAMLKSLAGAGDGVARSLVTANAGFSDGNKHLEEANKKYATFANQLKVLWSQINDIGITLGTAMLPALKELVQTAQSLVPHVESLVKAFTMMPGGVQAGVIAFAGLVAAAGPVLWTFGQIATAAGLVAGAFTTKGIAARALAGALGLLSAPVTAIVFAVGGLSVAWARMTGDWTRAFDLLFPPLGFLRAGWESLKQATEPYADVLADLASIISSVVTIAWEKFKDVLSSIANTVLPPLTKAFGFIKDSVSSVAAWIRDHAIAAFNELSQAIRNIPGVETLISIYAKLQGLGGDLRKGVHEIALGLKDAADAMAGIAGPAAAATAGFASLGQTGMLTAGAALDLLNAQLTQTPGLARGAGKAAGELGKELSKEEQARLKAIDDRKAALRDLNNFIGERRMEDEGAELDHIENLKKFWREYYNWLGERRMEDDAIALANRFNMPKIEWSVADLISAGAFGKIETELAAPSKWAGVGASIKEGLTGALGNIAQTIAQAFTGGGNLLGAIKSIVSQIGSAVGSAIGFALGGPLGQKIGSAIGSLAGSLVDGFKRLFGIGKDEAEKFRESLVKQGLTFQELERRAKSVGMTFVDVWHNKGKKGAEALQARLDLVNKAIEEQNRLLEEQKRKLEEQKSALEGELSTARSELQGLMGDAQQMGYIFDQNGELIGTSLDAVKSAAERVGIPIESLGKKFQGQKIAADAKSIVDSFTLLDKAGVTTGTILEGLQDEISKVVQESKKFGTTIPENMRPWILNLIAAGKLVDENGDKIEDLAGINFGPPIESEFQTIQKAIKATIDRIGDLISKIDDLINKIMGIPDKEYTLTEKRVTDDQRDPNDPIGPSPDEHVPFAAAGGFVRRSGAAQIHAGELIGPVRFMAQALRGAMALQPTSMAGMGGLSPALTGASGGAVGGHTTVIHNTFEFNVSTLDTDELSRLIRRRVMPEINSQLNNVGELRSANRDALGI